MKKIFASVLALAAVMAMVPVTQAHADTTPGWYVGAGAGANFTPNGTSHLATGNNTLNYDTGWDLDGSAGYAWTNGLRAEGEVWRSHADINKVTGPGAVSSNGHLTNTDLFGNVLYDFQTGTMVTPYIGAGIGVAFADADHIGTLSNGGQLNDSQTQFAYQAIAGINAQLDPNWAVTADYRYVASTDPSFKTTAGGNARTDNESHNVVVGVRYSFGQPVMTPVQATTAPRPMAKAAGKPVVAPVPQSYMVFFDFDKSDLTPEAKRILASAAQDYKRGTFIKVVVTGHTDTVGTIPYNQKLSERRAAAVKAELTHLGVDAQVITAVGAGKNGLLVPTADGVREAQNRRAEIVFDKQ